MEVSSEVEVPLRQWQRNTPSARRLDSTDAATTMEATAGPQGTICQTVPSRSSRPHKRKLSLLRGDLLSSAVTASNSLLQSRGYRCPMLPKWHEPEE
jgi:hypothetical protein